MYAGFAGQLSPFETKPEDLNATPHLACLASWLLFPRMQQIFIPTVRWSVFCSTWKTGELAYVEMFEMQ